MRKRRKVLYKTQSYKPVSTHARENRSKIESSEINMEDNKVLTTQTEISEVSLLRHSQHVTHEQNKNFVFHVDFLNSKNGCFMVSSVLSIQECSDLFVRHHTSRVLNTFHACILCIHTYITHLNILYLYLYINISCVSLSTGFEEMPEINLKLD